MTTAPFRRIVTGHDSQGRAIIREDGPPPRVLRLGTVGPNFYEVWNTRETPARIDAASGEPSEAGVILPPPKNGTRIRVVDMPPESADPDLTAEAVSGHFAQLGAADSHSGSRHPGMHRTETIDYGIVLEGEVVLMMDDGETVVRAGDIVVQRGTNHAWANRSDRNCRVAFVLIDGLFHPDIA